MPVTTGSFSGAPFPPEVLEDVWLTVLTGAPFAQAIQPLPTNNGSVAFRRVAPTGAAFTRELENLPQVVLNDDADVVAACKLAGSISLSNESLDDASIPIGDLTGQAIRDSIGPTLDTGLLYGDGTPPNPSGIVAKATASAGGADSRAAIIASYGELAGAGAVVTSITAFAHPPVVAAEWGRVDAARRPVHGDSANGQLTIGPGIPVIGVPGLSESPADVLVGDTSAMYLVQRESFTIEMSSDYGFASDSVALRVKARVNIACPTPVKSLRLATIAAPGAENHRRAS